MEKEKIKVGFSVDPKTVELIDQLSRETRRTKSVIIEIAVECYAAKELQSDNGRAK